MTDTRGREHPDEPAALLGGSFGKALAELAVARVDPDLAAGLGVDQAQLADVGELLLARVADLDRQGRMATGDAEQRVAPVDRAAKVRHDHDERALDGQPVEEKERLCEAAVP